MAQMIQALDEMKLLYSKVLGHPVPELKPETLLAFPPGVDPMRHAIEEVQYLRQVADQIASAPIPVAWVPRVDAYETADGYRIRLDVPGVRRDQVKVFVAGGECVVRGERTRPEGDDRPLALEASFGPFERRFPLAPGTRVEKLTARCADGVLELRLPREATVAPKETVVDVT
jgi:HSP20 family protein